MKKENLKKPRSGAPGAEKPRSGAPGAEKPRSGARGARQPERESRGPIEAWAVVYPKLPSPEDVVLVHTEKRARQLAQHPDTLVVHLQSVAPQHRAALSEVLVALPLGLRRALVPQLTVLAALLEVPVEAIGSDRRGSHWKERRVVPRYLVSVRGQGENQVTLELAAQAVEKTPQALNVALSKGRGVATFTVNDEIITVQRFAAGGHRA